MADQATTNPLHLIERLGRRFTDGVAEAGYLFALLVESLFWIFCGAF